MKNRGAVVRYAAITDTSSVSTRVLARLIGIVAVPGAPDLSVPQISLSQVLADPKTAWKIEPSYGQRRIWFVQRLTPDSP